MTPEQIRIKEQASRNVERMLYNARMESGFYEKWNSMKILITGNKGMIGREVASLLADYNVVGFDYVGSYSDWNKELAALNLPKLDLIIHIGAIFGENVDHDNMWEMNYQSTLKLGEIARKMRAKFLFFSSAAAINPAAPYGIKPYGWTKRVAEDILKAILPTSDLCIFRPYNVWSWGEYDKRSPSIIWKILTQKLDFVFSDCVRDFVFVSDVAKAVVSLVDRWHYGTYEVGTGVAVSVEDLVNEIYGHLDSSFDPIPIVTNEYSGGHLIASRERFPPDWFPIVSNISELSKHFACVISQGPDTTE